MNIIEKISKSIASRISTELYMDQDNEEVLAYGAFALIQTVITIIMLAVFGAVFDVLLEILIISFTASILRKFSGGAHATSPINCAVISVIIFGGLVLLLKYYVINMDLLNLSVGQIAAFIFAYYVMYRYSPVDSPNKPLRNEDKRNRLKRMSIKFLSGLLVTDIIFMVGYLYVEQIYFLVISICISLGVAWQSLTMVCLGDKIIDILDKLLIGVRKIR